MNFVIVFAALFAVAFAAPATNPADAQAQVLQLESDISPEGNYRHVLQTSNGIQAQAEGNLKPNPSQKSADDPAAIITARGSYSYTAEDGQTYTVNWVADENGFQPQGAHLPVA